MVERNSNTEQDGVARAAAFLAEEDEAQRGQAPSAGTAESGEATIAPAPSPERQIELNRLADAIIGRIQDIYDPEIPVNIYDLGLIYKIDVEDDNTVLVEMTLTSPNCPVAETLPQEVQYKIAGVEGVKDAKIEIVWEPPWNPSMMTEEAQLELGMMY